MAPDTPPRAGRREWIGLAVLALPCLLYSMDMTVLNLAVPALSADLKPTSSQLLWIVDIYGFFVAGSLVTMGTLGDRIGRRKLLLIGATLFGLASIFAAFASTAEMLILARAVLGISAATLAPSTLSLIRNMFHDPAERTFAIGIWISAFSAGGALGPIIGGVLLGYFWWGSVFLIAVPVMILLLAVAPFLLPEFRDPSAGRLDISSAALSIASVLAVIYGIKRLAEHGLGVEPFLFILLGLIIGTVFFRRQKRLDDPMIDVRLFRRPAFTAALATNLLTVFVAFGSFFFVAQYLQLVLGLSPLKAGLVSLPSSLAFIVGSTLTQKLTTRVRPPVVMAAGLLIAAAGFITQSWAAEAQSVLAMVLTFTLFSLGLAPVFTLTTDLIVGSVPPERAGAAAAMSETGAELGGALGVAILGSAVTALYRSTMEADALSGLPDEMAQTARDTLGGALFVAQQLPASLGETLLLTARDAFTRGLVLTSLGSAVIAFLTAILIMRMFRGSSTPGTQDGTGKPAPAPAE